MQQVEVEAVFEDGSRLAVVHAPFGPPSGEPTAPGAVQTAEPATSSTWVDTVEVTVTNEAAVPISVTSHFHFFEVNPTTALTVRRPGDASSPYRPEP